MIEFAYTITSESVDKTLTGFQGALAEQEAALAAIADDFREMMAQQFATAGRAEGTPWPPLSTPGGADIAPSAMSARRKPQTRHKAARSAPPTRWHPLLVRTGALLRSLSEAGAAGHVEEIEGCWLTLGTRLPYARYHQSGTRHLPARPLIVLSGARRERWTEIVRNEIEQKALLLGAKELAGEEG